ncbi:MULTISPECIES: TetR/AcrR family transcriptional regulator [unclassified Gordonia (in: high G+C Gram-positive bacteria)]|uniref:TetR/AcrR family transcriptional regulator n=1 Tax=unclassified Gordonia (in: high G+C Gram-positive bacteria) TaxID=2657482 RepID=UPI0009AE55BC|nr:MULTISPECIES: TetR/AcrR family transcriptional regulator [unclassified Gordonia (in: high G+C Gram-positive bacteria)]MDF3285541.1 TetR/AcrR family transcriptional regulator [Gordonia sp. N1V]OPX06531.1 TetR family transcriptional regulator [Gordonia sp. i37]
MAYIEAAQRREQMIAAARIALADLGVSNTSIRAVAKQAGVPLGTLQYVFPTKESLLKAVIEDVVDEIAGILGSSANVDSGLAHAIHEGISTFWSRLVSGHAGLQLMQYELTTYALRTANQQALARWQYERYTDVVAQWCQQAANKAGETCSLPFTRLARIIVAAIDGLILQYVCDPNESRSREDLKTVAAMIVEAAKIEKVVSASP